MLSNDESWDHVRVTRNTGGGKLSAEDKRPDTRDGDKVCEKKKCIKKECMKKECTEVPEIQDVEDILLVGGPSEDTLRGIEAIFLFCPRS